MKSHFLISSLLLSLTSISVLAAAPQPEIQLNFNEKNPRHIAVEVKWTLDKPEFSIANWGAEQFNDGWAHFIKDLRVEDEQQRAVPIEFDGKSTWKTKAKVGQALTLHYVVDMSHDQHEWPHGLDEATYVKDDAIFSTGQALFVVPDDAEQFSVKFNLPASWKSSTPWPKQNDVYRVNSYDALVYNVIMVGRHQEIVFREGDFAVTVAVGQARSASVPNIEKVMRPAIKEYVRLFGDVPKNNYLVTLHDGLTDGGGFDSSYSLLASEDFHSSNVIEWGHLVAHETLHMWNGTGMHPAADLEWVKEGFSEYYTFLTLYKLGVIDDVLLSKKFENHTRRLLAHRDDVSLVESIKDKRKYWDFMYGGGAMMALVLDYEIRQATQGKKTLEHLMRQLFTQYKGKEFKLKQFGEALNQVAGRDLSDLINRHVVGKEKPDVKPAFAALGFDVVLTTTREVYLIDKPNAKALRQQWLSKN